MLFAEFDHGAIVRRGTGRDTPRIVRFIIGNPLIMRRMVQHVPDAGSYAPVTILIDERPGSILSSIFLDKWRVFSRHTKTQTRLKSPGN